MTYYTPREVRIRQEARDALEQLKALDMEAWRERVIREAHQRFLAEKKQRSAA